LVFASITWLENLVNAQLGSPRLKLSAAEREVEILDFGDATLLAPALLFLFCSLNCSYIAIRLPGENKNSFTF
jgi:hypothetical protein